MEFIDLNSISGLKTLNEYLSCRSYITGFEPSQNDVSVFRSIRIEPSEEKDQRNLKRWYLHIKSFPNEQMKLFPQPKEKVVITPQEGCEVTEISSRVHAFALS